MNTTRERVTHLRRKGWTLRRIGAEIGISTARVQHITAGVERLGIDYTRDKVRQRDGFKCRQCGRKWNGKERHFDVHHLGGICGKKSRQYDRITAIDDLITLCHKCHLNLPEVRAKMRGPRK